MTDAQKKSRARFKAAVSEAAKLRKKNPRLSQAEAVKQAWAILYGKERAGKKIAGPKKPAKKTATKKASKPGERHTDTKSHNVNIRVMSGVKSDIKKRLKQSGKRLKHGYQIVPGDIRKISGLKTEGNLLHEAIVKRNATESEIQRHSKEIKRLEEKMSTFTPVQRGRARAFILIYKKINARYRKELKEWNAYIEKISKN